MDLLTLVVTLVIIGFALYLINRFVPMDAKIKTILNWAVVIVVILWLLRAFGLFGSMSSIKVGG